MAERGRHSEPGPQDPPKPDIGRYLLFDGSCSVCSHLADSVETAADGRVTAASLRDPRFRAILDQARPGWRFEPTLVTVDSRRARVTVGFRMRLRMAGVLGPRRAFRVTKIMRRSGVPVLAGGRPSASGSARSRRWFLGAVGAAAGAVGVAAFVKQGTTRASAEDCTERNKCLDKCDADYKNSTQWCDTSFTDCVKKCGRDDAECIQKCANNKSACYTYAYENYVYCQNHCPPCQDDQQATDPATTGSSSSSDGNTTLPDSPAQRPMPNHPVLPKPVIPPVIPEPGIPPVITEPGNPFLP